MTSTIMAIFGRRHSVDTASLLPSAHAVGHSFVGLAGPIAASTPPIRIPSRTVLEHWRMRGELPPGPRPLCADPLATDRPRESLAFGLMQPYFERGAQHQVGLDGYVAVARPATPPQVCHCSSASPVIHKIKLPSRRSPASYSGYFSTLNFILGMW
jgi:hypothetical protein